MKRIGRVKIGSLVSILNWGGLPLISVYIFCMFLYPWVAGHGDWSYVQSVWHNWQSLNVGVLAFLSSIVALNISRFNASKQRERNFVAARAFLPEALSELTGYFKLCAELLTEAWQRANNRTTRIPLLTHTPNLPEGYREVFSRCIGSAEPDVGEHLAYILMSLQVHNSRLNELSNSFSEDSTMIVVPENIITYLYRLAELQALTNKTFGFARNLEMFDSSNLVWNDYENAYSTLDIWVEDFDDLVGFTQRAIERNNSVNNT